ncbi:hypothetical protein [Pradoshia sp.]
MSSKEKLVSILKELEEEIAALEEKMIRKTQKEYDETLSEFHLFIKNRSREMEARMDVVENKMNQHLKYRSKDDEKEALSPAASIKVAYVHDF